MSRPFRFTFIIILTGLATGLAAVGGWRYARASAPVSGPIVLVSIDSLRADHLPAYGYHDVKTPFIDELAADGVVFERAYSHAVQTLPAHVALLSGRLPFENGVRDDLGSTLKPGERLLAQMLRDRGYATGGIVSAGVLRKATGIARGFDLFDDEMVPESPDQPIEQARRDGMESEAVAERWLGSVGTSRAFLFLHLDEPHRPYDPPARYGQYAPYDGEIAYADEIVGRLVRYLKSHQLYDRSTIVLLSDHGEGLGDHGEQAHGLFVYDEAIHVPLIIKQESNTGAGRRVRDVVQHIDIVPTILDLAKAPLPGNLRGRSLKPLLDGSDSPRNETVYSEALFAQHRFGWGAIAAVTNDRYQYIRAPRPELYDLQRDPNEQDNVVDDQIKDGQALGRALDRMVPPAVDADTPPDPKDRLQIAETYRSAMELAGERKWPRAIALLQRTLHEDPAMANVWTDLATFAIRVGRYEQALDAYKTVIELEPESPPAYLGAADVLLRLRRLDAAREDAESAASAAAKADPASRAAAHEVLAKIALARHDADAALAEAELAQKADRALPMPLYVRGRLLYDQGRYDDALPLFEQAVAELKTSPASRMPDLQFYLADTLVRLERYPDAEAHYLDELRGFPLNVRARAGLAALYETTGRPEEAGRAIEDLIRITPTPEAYTLAARLWTLLGDRQRADAVRAEARRVFSSAPAAAVAPH